MPQREHPEPAAPASKNALPSQPDDFALGVPLEYCPTCSAKLLGRSCKLLCPRCGYFLSCSDYY